MMSEVRANEARSVLAFDTANEVIALGIGEACADSRTIRLVAERHIPAHRASNTQLVPSIDELMNATGLSRDDIACVVCGAGPGSFTGVRIAMATAKGIASALGVGLITVSSLDAVAWNAWADGERGRVAVVADAMRKEVYPVVFDLTDAGVQRTQPDRVMKVVAAVEELSNSSADADTTSALRITGDALQKYAEAFSVCGEFLDETYWTPTGRGLLLAAQAAWTVDLADPFDTVRHNPGYALPIYTRLSDAEENERIRLAQVDPKNLKTGVQGDEKLREDGSTVRDSMHNLSQQAVDARVASTETAADGAADADIRYVPMAAAHAQAVSDMEHLVMGSDAWSPTSVLDELSHKDRTWWVALDQNGTLLGYAGGWIVDGDVQILKIGVTPAWRRHGIAAELIARVTDDARNLGATTASLEVRVSNEGAQAFYQVLGFESLGVRPRYYSDHEDACIMQATLPLRTVTHDVAGMELRVHEDVPTEQVELCRPLIFAIESSCDETAAAIIDGQGRLVSDVVASQIDFHARFGGVVPEIASRKHIEAICGVCDECLDVAARTLGIDTLTWVDLDAVSVTYAPGLVGALVVGVAFAKGAAWAADKPFIGVHHLEGHLYANKIATPDLTPPAVVSLVSGGNTMLVHMKDWGDYETLGSTIDDAVGEAFDKVAKALGLGYPGGPVISKAAAQGNPDAIAFPRAMMHSGDLRFSLSGLKTAVITYIQQQRAAGEELSIPDIAASFQQAVVDVQVSKAKKALEQTGAKEFCLGGGVAANPALRAAYEDLCANLDVRLTMPPMHACTDNAGMIALVAADRYAQGKFFDLSQDAFAHADLDQPY